MGEEARLYAVYGFAFLIQSPQEVSYLDSVKYTVWGLAFVKCVK